VTLAPRTRARVLLAFQGACVSAVAFYAMLRVVQALLFESSNSVRIVPSPHTGYFWRAWTVAYAGVMAGFAVFAAAKRYEAEVCRALVWALYVASTLLVLQGLFVP
jgi:hypothetical protein